MGEISLQNGSEVGASREYVEFVGIPDQRGRKFARRRRAKSLSQQSEKVHGDAPSWVNVRKCGVPLGEVSVAYDANGKCHFRGVIHCCLAWVCAVCSARIRAARVAEIERGSVVWADRGGTFAMFTLTVSHDASMPLVDVMGALTRSWRNLQMSRSYRQVRGEVEGTIKGLEMTFGANGWHPHLHVLLFVRPGSDVVSIGDSFMALTGSWIRSVSGALGRSPLPEYALDFRVLGSDSAGYVAKIAKEIASSDTKSGRDPLAFLDVDGSNVNFAVAKFCEYADATYGRQAVSWSKGLRKLLGLVDPVGDDLLEEVTLLFFIPRSLYLNVLRAGDEDSFLSYCETLTPLGLTC